MFINEKCAILCTGAANIGVKEKRIQSLFDWVFRLAEFIPLKTASVVWRLKLGPHEKSVGSADNLGDAGLYPYSGKHRTSVEWNYPSKAVPTGS